MWPPMLLLGYALASVVGLALGLLGGGGSILTVPVLAYVMGFEAKRAIAMSLPVVGLTSLLGVAAHWRAGRVDLRMAVMFGLFTMGGAFVGARLATYVSGAEQLAILGGVIVIASVFMMRPPKQDLADDPVISNRAMVASRAVLLLCGLGVGMLTGVVGVGGGFLIVPALVLFGRIPIKHAIGTALLVITMNCASGFVGYLGRVAMDWTVIALFTAIASVGVLVGTRLSGRISSASLKRGFAVFLLAIGAMILYQNHNVLAGRSAVRLSSPPIR
jgi:uncharacterized membrane protein YfcA